MLGKHVSNDETHPDPNLADPHDDKDSYSVNRSGMDEKS